jgi:hypothetical protein
MDKQQLEAMMEQRRRLVDPVDLLNPVYQQTSIPASGHSVLPANPKARVPASLTKYSTWLPGDLIKQVKLAAIERGVKDYQLIIGALEAYLKKETDDR